MAKQRNIESFVRNMTAKLPSTIDGSLDPFTIFGALEVWCVKENLAPEEGIPNFSFYTKKVKKKRRLIGVPNDAMRKLHRLFQIFVEKACKKSPELASFQELPSATAFVGGSSPVNNVARHLDSRYFYILDLKNAYNNVSTSLLAQIITAILRFDEYELDLRDFLRLSSFGVPIDNNRSLDVVMEDPLFLRLRHFLLCFFTAPNGYGLVTGGPASPYLFNLFCEATLDVSLRKLVGELRGVSFTRYADDLVFSQRGDDRPRLLPLARREIRNVVASSGAIVNHRKSRFLDRNMGTVFITGLGIDQNGRVVFPQKKRTKLRGMLRTALQNPTWGLERVSKISGHIAHFREYLKAVQPFSTMSDDRIITLIDRFEANFK